jgi:bifunctional N-acetylglucosamine-1-phosphate-uridyltransferase/glucosamine-1-phosphate-acetyltransferase GlmU-like protein
MRYAVIMAGGTGTRFWPESRKALPKQLLRLGSTQSLLERTVRRIEPLIPVERMLLVTGDALVDCIHEHVPGLPAQNLLTEPLRRNTGPCMALAAKVLLDRDPDAVLAALSADHLIQREPLFREIVDAAMTMAAERDVVSRNRLRLYRSRRRGRQVRRSSVSSRRRVSRKTGLGHGRGVRRFGALSLELRDVCFSRRRVVACDRDSSAGTRRRDGSH